LCGDGDCFNGLDHFEAFYNFDGDANDASVNGRNLNGGYPQSAGKLGSAASFSGANQELYLNPDFWDMYAAPQSFTVSFWIQRQQQRQEFFTADAFSAMGISIQSTAQDTVEVCIPGAGYVCNLDMLGNTVWAYGVLYHVAVVHDAVAKTVKLYVNGALDTSGSYAQLTNPVQYHSYWGFSVNGSATGGSMEYGGSALSDAYGLWSRPLAAQDISILYNGGSGRQYPF
jgi:hypothetical protein